MIGYSTIGVKDLDAAKEFYCNLFDAEVHVDVGRLAMIGKSATEPKVAVCIPFNEEPADPGNGNMIAFAADTTEEVDALYNKAVELGATCDGAPGERIPDVFYGAYVKDADGNKLAFFKFL